MERQGRHMLRWRWWQCLAHQMFEVDRGPVEGGQKRQGREGRSPEGITEWWEEKDDMKAREGGVDGKEWLHITGEREKGAQDADRWEPRACAT